MARKARRGSKTSALEEILDLASSESAVGSSAPAMSVPSKSEAIRRAIAAGYTGPQEGTAWIREKYGIDLTPMHFSSVKAHEKKKAGGKPKGRPGRKPKSALLGVESYIAAPARSGGAGEKDLLAALEAMKPLVERLGANQVKRIVDLLG